MKKETGRWIKKAEADLRCARLLAKEVRRDNDLICFHCQQSAEKYLKAFLQELGAPVPRTHSLDYLLELA